MNEKRQRQLHELIREELDIVVNLRHALHHHPELGFQELETSRVLQSFIQDVPGIEINSGLAGTGFAATIGGSKKGKCIAFRADMDALPIEESTGLPYASKVPGVMHACGHDGHSAILAGLVRVLSKYEGHLKGPVKFIFQPAEEGGAGGEKMVSEGALQNPAVDMIFGLHGWPSLNLGEVGAGVGPVFASTNAFDITVTGKRGHAAFPHLAVDPMPVAAAIISGFQTLVSRNTDPLDSVVVSICEIKGGSAYNVIPEQIALKGTLRCFSQSQREKILLRMEQMTEQLAAAYGAMAQLKLKDIAYPVLHNDVEATSLFRKVCESLPDSVRLSEVAPSMGGEDFAYYAEKVPACFWLLGVKEPESQDWPFLHTSNYDFNDAAIEIGIRVQAEIALKYQMGGF